MVTRKEMDSRMCVREHLLPCLCAASQLTQEGKRPGQCETSRPETPDGLQTAEGHARSFHLELAKDQLLKTKSKRKADRKKPTGRNCLKEQLDWELRPQNKGANSWQTLTSLRYKETTGHQGSPLLVTLKHCLETFPDRLKQDA